MERFYFLEPNKEKDFKKVPNKEFPHKYSSSANLQDLYGQHSSTLYPLLSVENIFSNWQNGVDSRFKLLIRVRTIAVIWYVPM